MNSKFVLYILKRILLGLFTYLLVVTLTFWIMQMVPGGPWNMEKAPSQAVIDELNRQFGLDKPLGIQWLYYLKNALTFNFGMSFFYRGRLVTSIISDGFKYSFIIGFFAAFLALILGITFGTLCAKKQNKFVDRFIMILTTASVAVPTFVISLILLYTFGVTLKWFPTTPVNVEGPGPYILPIIATSLYPCAYITRLCRSSTLDVLGQDYMRTAKSKGLGPTRVLVKHGLRNSLTPVITYFGPMFASIITGSLVIEKIFSIPGIGGIFYKAITNRDYATIMGTTCLLSLLLIVFTLLSDILYKVINPRVDFD